MTGFKIVTAGFEQGVRNAKKLAQMNTMLFGRSVADEYRITAKRDAPWTDRHGAARRNLYAECVQTLKTRVRVDMGGSAPNYKKGPKSYEDYLEILEFGYNSKKRNFPELAIIYPTFEAICSDVREQYGESVLRGEGAKYRINRSKAAQLRRNRAYYARTHR